MALPHNGGAVDQRPSRVIARWPEGTFLENLAVAPDGSLLVTVHNRQSIARVEPQTGAVSSFADLPMPVAGIVVDPAGVTWLSGGTPGTAPGVIWRIDPAGNVRQWVILDDAMFLNGMTLNPDGRRLLVAESILGRIYAVDITTPTASIWLEDPLLRPETAGQTPGANGIKLFGGAATITVTDRNAIFRVPISPDVSPAGPLRPLVEDLRGDDFAFDTRGRAFIATHPMNSVVMLDPDGHRTTIATAEQEIIGPTAVLFARGEAAIYVTTNGGMVSPLNGVVRSGCLVRIEVDASGAPIGPTA